MFFQRDVYLSTLHLIKNFFSFREGMSRDKNRLQKMLLKTTWFNWNNNSKQLLNVLRHARLLHLCLGYTSWYLHDQDSDMLPLHFSKTSPKCGDAYSKSTFFCLSSWARWNRPVLAKISSFSLKTSLDRWKVIKWCFTSSLQADSRTKPLNSRDEPKFFPSLLLKKQSWD